MVVSIQGQYWLLKNGLRMVLDWLTRLSLIFHFTHDAGKPSPSSTKGMHISTVGHNPPRVRSVPAADPSHRQKKS